MRFPITTGQYFGTIQDFKASPDMTVITIGHDIEFDQPFKRHHFETFPLFLKFYSKVPNCITLAFILFNTLLCMVS